MHLDPYSDTPLLLTSPSPLLPLPTTGAPIMTDMSFHGESVAEKAERRAFELLQAPEALTKEHILELYDLAPTQCKQGPTNARQMMTGGNPRSSNAPLHNIFDLPCVTQAVTKFVRHYAPGIPFSTVTILEGAKHGVHVDTRNASPPNVILNLTTFQGGGLWIEQTGGPDHLKYEGRTMQGKIWSLEAKPVVFSASRLKHVATPWKGARRVVLIAFTVGPSGPCQRRSGVFLRLRASACLLRLNLASIKHMSSVRVSCGSSRCLAAWSEGV